MSERESTCAIVGGVLWALHPRNYKLAPQEGLALRLGIKKSKIKQLVRLTTHVQV